MAASRRNWLRGVLRLATAAAGMAAALAGAHGLLARRAPRYPARPAPFGGGGRVRLIRPPGAVAEEAFLAGCIRCYRCQDACEPGAIQFFTESAGELYHTPYVDPSVKACNLCSHTASGLLKCTHACPAGVLAPMEIERRAEVAMGGVELEMDRCLSYKAKALREQQYLLMMLGESPTEAEAEAERRGPCGECYTICPRRERAIQLEPGAFLAPIIFPDQCIGCGLCEEICSQMVRGRAAIRVVAARGEVG